MKYNICKNIVVLGASSGVGRALSIELAKQECSLLLVARDERDLKSLSDHISIAYNTQCGFLVCDLYQSQFDAETFLQSCLNCMGKIDALIVPAGIIDDNDDGLNLKISHRIITVNFTSIALTVSAFCDHFKKQDSGHVVVFSSIAASVPRKKMLRIRHQKRLSPPIAEDCNMLL